ncbi:MAG: hypothetical protein P8Z42_08360, partial [Anaerolineales bacterium]
MKINRTHRTNKSARIAILLALLLSLLVVVPALADYLGPDRTETTYVNRRRHCHYNAVYDPPGPGYDTCYMDLYTTPEDSCPSNVGSYFNHAYCGGGWPTSCADPGTSCSINLNSSIESCIAGQTGCRSVAQTVTHPPATISGSINCPQTGDNGWCTAAASLSLSGNEPLSGYNIITLEGTHNGTTFAFSGDSGYINLVEGANAFTLWVPSKVLMLYPLSGSFPD